MECLESTQIAHLFDVHGIRFYPKLKPLKPLRGDGVRFEPLTQHPPEGMLPLGVHSYSQSYIPRLARVGRYCSIGVGVTLLGASHPTDWVSSHPLFYNKRRYQRFMGEQAPYTRSFRQRPQPITIGNDVWIGNNVALKGGITIHDGAIIAYGAVVTRDVPPYTIVGGVPARTIRKRFDPNLTRAMQDSQWWTYDVRDIAAMSIETPRQFLSEFEFLAPNLRPFPDCRGTVEDFLAADTPLLQDAA